MRTTNVLYIVLALVCTINISSVLPGEPQSDRYDRDKGFLEKNEYKEGFRREMYVQFRSDSPIKGCRVSGGGGG